MTTACRGRGKWLLCRSCDAVVVQPQAASTGELLRDVEEVQRKIGGPGGYYKPIPFQSDFQSTSRNWMIKTYQPNDTLQNADFCEMQRSLNPKVPFIGRTCTFYPV